MNLQVEMRDIFDRFQRKAGTSPEVERFITENYQRGWMPKYNIGFVTYTKLNDENADAIIQELIRFFSEQGADEFEWKYYDYDTPQDLPERLVKAGLKPDPVESVMILTVNEAPPKLLNPVTYDIRKIVDVDTLQDADKIHHVVWNSSGTPVTDRVSSMWDIDPDSLSLYIAYVDDIPVSYGRLEFMPEGNPFASIWGGSTIPEFRGRGIYTQLVASRLQEAKERGYLYLSVDANPNTSMPILQKLGFEHFANTTPFMWTNTDK